MKGWRSRPRRLIRAPERRRSSSVTPSSRSSLLTASLMRRLGDVHLAAGAPQRAALDDGGDVLELLDAHPGSLWLLSVIGHASQAAPEVLAARGRVLLE